MKTIASILILFFLVIAGGHAAVPAASKTEPEQEKLAKLNEEINRLMIAMDQFEELHNRKKYMETLDLASQKNREAAAIWDKTEQSKQGLADGMLSGIFEMYSQHMPAREKVCLLADKYHLKPETVEKIKSDLEIMFAQELAEKYASVPQEQGAQAEGVDAAAVSQKKGT